MFTAILIAIIYVTLVIFINIVVGKEAAGIASVTLTALSVATFKQFETLRFKENHDATTTISIGFRWWPVLLIGILLRGFSSLLVDLMDALVPLFISNAEKTSKDVGIIDGNVINYYSIWENSTKCLAFFICGVIIARTFKRISYSVIIVGGLLAAVLDFYTEYLYFIIFRGVKFDAKSDFDDYKFSIFWIIAAFIGCYISQSKKKTLV